MRKLRICHAVESYYPAMGGMPEVVRQLSERLVQLGHEVTVATRKIAERESRVHHGVNIREFDIIGNEVEGYTGDVKSYTDFLKTETGQFDIITFFAAQQWATDLALPLLDEIPAKKVNVPTGYSHLYTPRYAEYFERMKMYIRKYDMNVYLSEDYRDINFAREQGVTKLMLIPNGAALDEFASGNQGNILEQLGVDDGDFVLMHVGSFVKSKGQADATEIFLRSNLVHAKLILVGNKPENYFKMLRRRPALLMRYWLTKIYGSKKVIHTSLSRKQTVQLYHACDLFFFPSMIECSPIVLFEAMAAAKPFLVTDVGNAKEIVKWSNGGWTMPTISDPNGFSRADVERSVKMLEDLWSDPAKLYETGRNGHDAWKKKFTWEHITRKYESLYLELTA